MTKPLVPITEDGALSKPTRVEMIRGLDGEFHMVRPPRRGAGEPAAPMRHGARTSPPTVCQTCGGVAGADLQVSLPCLCGRLAKDRERQMDEAERIERYDELDYRQGRT